MRGKAAPTANVAAGVNAAALADRADLRDAKLIARVGSQQLLRYFSCEFDIDAAFEVDLANSSPSKATFGIKSWP